MGQGGTEKELLRSMDPSASGGSRGYDPPQQTDQKTEVGHCALTRSTDNRDRLSAWFYKRNRV